VRPTLSTTSPPSAISRGKKLTREDDRKKKKGNRVVHGYSRKGEEPRCRSHPAVPTTGRGGKVARAVGRAIFSEKLTCFPQRGRGLKTFLLADQENSAARQSQSELLRLSWGDPDRGKGFSFACHGQANRQHRSWMPCRRKSSLTHEESRAGLSQ